MFILILMSSACIVSAEETPDEDHNLEGTVKFRIDSDNLRMLSLSDTSFRMSYPIKQENDDAGSIEIMLTINDDSGQFSFVEGSGIEGSAEIYNDDQESGIVLDISASIIRESDICNIESGMLICQISNAEMTDIEGETAYLSITISLSEADIHSATSYSLDHGMGELTADFTGIAPKTPDTSMITESFKGKAYRLIQGDKKSIKEGILEIRYDDRVRTYQINDGKWGESEIIEITALEGTEISFFIGGRPAGSSIIGEGSGGVNDPDLMIESGPGLGFSDNDRDGVPDEMDECPDSTSFSVNERGCGCEDISMDENHICEETELGSVIISDKKKKKESGDDTSSIIYSESKYNNDQLCENCPECSCRKGFTCSAKGKCVMSIDLEGKKCMVNNFHKYSNKVKCKKKLGDSWIKFNHKKYIDIDVDGHPLIEDIVQDIIDDAIEEYTICVDTDDMGCVVESVKCFGENQVTKENKKIASKIIDKEIEKEIWDSISEETPYSWVLQRLFDIEVDTQLDDFRIYHPYACDQIQIDEAQSCRELIKNGPESSKADILFIGDGFKSYQHLKYEVLTMIDYENDYEDSKRSGFFSEEPFRSHKDKFNIWYMESGDGEITYEEDSANPSIGEQPALRSIANIANRCPWFDYIVFISANNKFRANCMLGSPGPCRLSLRGEDYPGRLLVHEMGHGFASLADEYYNLVERRKSDKYLEQFFSAFQTGANCISNTNDAMDKWGVLADSNPDINFFYGCGGDCDSTCSNFVRPTINSVMKHQEVICSSEDECHKGPPFDGFYAVNKLEIMNVLDQYS
ncbi:hypothetical protein GF345_03425 [Candidatus Woesearchaeota archaeon]|nr:hypothetical protein [Candidatus Woesearchaeota archaeon]